VDGPVSQKLEEVIIRWEMVLGVTLKKIVFEKNFGLGAALSCGVKAATSDLIARMDADDYALPLRISEQLDFFYKNPEVDICGGQAENIDMQGQITGYRRVPIHHSDIKKIIWANPIIHPTVMFKKEKIILLGSYRPNAINRNEDFDLWFRAACAGLRFANLTTTLVRYRVLTDSYKKNNFTVAFSRFRIALKAVKKFDNKTSSYIAICYPLIKSLLPSYGVRLCEKHLGQLDPRRRSWMGQGEL
jgi:amylovoran biosynthesis glycosyltransferase AmsE